MRILLNILWMIFGGLISWAGWVLVGCLWCITIVGIPVGMQCFKLASISLNPFGKDVTYPEDSGISMILNVIWIFFGGLEMAALNLTIGVILCITIIGIPFGKQFFKIARVALLPFGAEVVRVNVL
ncbi:MAG: YccF domain-containing protein [Solobacterium sp.]|nr:YccF domain-containing protein [Solobacterium sp.]